MYLVESLVLVFRAGISDVGIARPADEGDAADCEAVAMLDEEPEGVAVLDVEPVDGVDGGEGAWLAGELGNGVNASDAIVLIGFKSPESEKTPFRL